jgi:transcriptional antiterminator RfaH
MRHEIGFSAIERRPWIVVNTQAHRERTALDNLARQEFATYCPLVRKRVRHARRTQDVLRPLFPGYVFVQVDPDLRRWRPILSTMGVRRVVCAGDKPSLLAEDFIAGLKAREVDGAVARPVAPYEIGQKVRIMGGAFDGLIASILDLDEKERLVVLMDILNRPTRVRIESQTVMPADQ